MIKGFRGTIQVQRGADSRGSAHPCIDLLAGRAQYHMATDGIAEQQNMPVAGDRRSSEGRPQVLGDPTVKDILARVVRTAQ
jgi:hypothetical protein